MRLSLGYRGMSILTLLPIIAMTSALILTLMSSVDIMTRSSRATEISEQVAEFTSTLNMIALDPALCPLYFNNVTFTTGTGVPENITALPFAAGTNPEFPSMTTTQLSTSSFINSNRDLQISSLQWVCKTNISGTIYSGLLGVTLTKSAYAQANSYGSKSYSVGTLPTPLCAANNLAVGIPFTFNVVANKITGCVASGYTTTINAGWYTSPDDLSNSSICTPGTGTAFTCPEGTYVVRVNMKNMNNNGANSNGANFMTLNSYSCCKVRGN